MTMMGLRKTLLLTVLLQISGTTSAISSIVVQDGVYSRVTVQIEDQPQPENCVAFLDQVEAVLNETSYGLHTLTQRQGLIKEFDIVLPKSWNVPKCQPGRQMTSEQRTNPTRPDLLIDAKLGRGQSGPRPWTEQPQGCGRPGYGIHVPKKFFDLEAKQATKGGDSSWEIGTKGHILLKEWCKYRYGIFPENGFIGDNLYPDTYQEGNNTLASRGCSSQPDVLCPLGQVYNRAAPTKQNLLCNEQSGIESVLNHEDFQTTWQSIYDDANSEEINELDPEEAENSTSTTTTTTTTLPPNLVYPVSAKEFSSPKFRYIVPKSSRYVLLLERSSFMNAKGRWTNLRRALYRFIQYLPTGSELSIISFGSDAKVDLPPTVVTDLNREGLHGRIPRKVIIDDDLGCVFCALNVSLKALNNYMGQVETGTLILVSGSSQKPTFLEDFMGSVQLIPLQVYPVFYPSSNAHPDLLNLARFGKAYAIPEGDEQSGVTPLNYLSEVLLDILHHSENLRIQKVHETKHLSYEFAGTFTMEQEILHKMHVTLTVDDENKVEFFEVTNPSGKKHLFSQFEDGMVVFSHPGMAQAGIWTYHAKLYPNTGLSSNTKMTVDVVSQSNNAEAEPFILEVFTDAQIVDAHQDRAAIIYARLTKGNAPVIGANVQATVFRPGSNPPVVLSMRDNGAGYPDITAQDGIYSVYFTDFASVPGFYSVQVSADNNGGSARTPRFAVATATSATLLLEADLNSSIHAVVSDDSGNDCCGSSMNFGDTMPAASFMRQAAGPTFYVKQGLSGRTDVAPPSRVIDFHVSSVVNDSLYVELEWTAPGDDFDQGKASKYEIRCYTSRDALNAATFTEKGILVHDSFTPEPLDYGSRQTCTVGVPWPNEVFYYALVAIDKAGNRSPISNILSVYIFEAPTTTTTTTTTTTLLRTNSAAVPLFSEDVDILNEVPWSKHARVYIATGVICGLLLIIVSVIIFILFRVRAKRMTTAYDAENRDTYKAYEPSTPAGGNGGSSSASKGASKSISSWLDSLPRSEMHNTLRSNHDMLDGQHSPNTTGTHDLSIGDGTLRRNNNNGTNSNTHTLTKTNPYRHKVLTNGSFLNLNLKDVVGQALPSSGSSDDASNSSRPTTSTEDANSDSENHKLSQLRRSKSVANGSKFGSGNPAPDLLPPPDGFDAPGANVLQQQYHIDTSTAKAIIDTYSGHLFSRGYSSFNNGKAAVSKYPTSVVEKLFTRDPTNMDKDSLEHNSSNSNYYEKSQQQQHQQIMPVVHLPPKSSNSRVKTRTESVV